MRQYQDAKRQHPDALLFFRMGDFYELFYEDAVVAARAVELTLTSRSKDATGTGIPMCGVPFHAADGYIMRLVRQGISVAICDQIEDPKSAKGLVKRAVTRVVTPGTLIDAAYLDARAPALLAAIVPPRKGVDVWGLAWVELSTGDFAATEFAGDTATALLRDELGVLSARELLVPDDMDLETLRADGLPLPAVTRRDSWQFALDSAQRALTGQLQTSGLAGFGLDGHPHAIGAAGALVQYLRDTQKGDLSHVRTVTYRETRDGLIVDATTLRHLEVLSSTEGDRQVSLLGVLDDTVTAMGARLMRAWLTKPLVDLDAIRDRLDAVEDLAFRSVERGTLRDGLKPVYDVHRLVARAALGTAGPRDLVALARSLGAVPALRQTLSTLQAPLLAQVVEALDDLPALREQIAGTLADEPPLLARDGDVIRDGADPEVDRLRGLSRRGKDDISSMEEAERIRTGITSLKIRFNRVFGYYIEVSKSNLHAVPDDYIRKQTIAGGERFITPALKTFEEQVLHADEHLIALELALFETLRREVATHAPALQRTAHALAVLDVLATFADVAARRNYSKPHVHDGDDMSVVEGRHPVVETMTREAFVPNDLSLDGTSQQLLVITGPNMGGKSTYLRQTALLCLMAQAGSFVPARQAKLPVVDRIYARVGAADNIARGQSTFMVEMQETASILNTATSRSLVVLDEIGRGTSTFDGLSIAWAVAEHLASGPKARPKTLFATHYHELTDLADALPGVANAHLLVREWQDQIVFLRKVVPGRSDRSYGIQVARLAGLPPTVIRRAREILTGLEQDELTRGGRPTIAGASALTGPQQQLGLFQAPADDRLRDRLRELDVDNLTPLQALALLADLKQEADA
ncbi:MAG: DNA mismatch repair protein MutS [Acidobacteria bacterium]|nr:DNA mismatch repair protein MutS [Acidobacteriota bacterium]